MVVDDEGAAFLVGQRRQLGPGPTAVGAADDSQGAPNIGVSTSTLRGRDDEGAVVEAGEVGVVEEVEVGVGDMDGNCEV